MSAAARRPARRLARAAAWLATAALPAAACGPDVPETIGREAFIDAYVALRVAELTDRENEVISAEARERVLEDQGVTEEELFGFVEVHGGDVDFMKELWKEVERRMEDLRNPADTTGTGGEAGGARNQPGWVG